MADIKKLKSAGICTVKVCSTLRCLSNERVCVTHVFLHIVHAKGVQMTTKKRLCTIKGLSEAKVDKIKVTASLMCQLLSP